MLPAESLSRLQETEIQPVPERFAVLRVNAFNAGTLSTNYHPHIGIFGLILLPLTILGAGLEPPPNQIVPGVAGGAIYLGSRILLPLLL